MNDQARLKVLITNLGLDLRGGTESVVRDIALGLLRRGHRPIVYSPHLGPPAFELQQRGVATISDLGQMAEAPDVIHGQHFIQTAEAILHFPSTPVVSVCHAWTFWQERPPKFPQVRRYVCVDEAVRDRLVHVEGIDSTKTEIILNAVDLTRIPPRPAPLSRKPQTALAFTKNKAQLPILAAACEQRGIRLSTLGAGGDRQVAEPENELVRYDVVFATARMALEAMCAGAAVIICDARGFGGPVSSGNLEHLRRLNFGLRALVHQVSPEAVSEALAGYDPDDAAAVSAAVRDRANFEVALDRYVAVYQDAIADMAAHPVAEADYRKARLAFLNQALPRRRTDGRWLWMVERENLMARINELDRELAAARQTPPPGV
jgi:hypothetical protein